MFHLQLSMIGVKAVNKHLSSDKHKENFKIQNRKTSFFKFMPLKYSTVHDKVTATELTLTRLFSSMT